MNMSESKTMAIDLGKVLQHGVGHLIGIAAEDLALGLDVAKRHMQRGAPAEALKIYAALVLCDPARLEFQIGLANCALDLGEHEMALQAASAIVATAPADPRGYYLSGRACFGLGAVDEALEDLADAERFARSIGDAALTEAVRNFTLLVQMPKSASRPS